MVRQLVRIDVGAAPELLRVVEEVHATGEPVVLQRNGEDLAVLMPAPRKRRPPSKAQPVTRDDPLFGLIGIGKGKTPGGASSKKHDALAKAYRHR